MENKCHLLLHEMMYGEKPEGQKILLTNKYWLDFLVFSFGKPFECECTAKTLENIFDVSKCY